MPPKYVITPKAGQKFTEFYILGLEGKAANYPDALMVGEEGKQKARGEQDGGVHLVQRGEKEPYDSLYLRLI